MKISKEFKVGLLALVAMAMLYFGFNFLRGVDFFSSNNRYYVIYDDIKGLTVSNSVTVNGMAVGRVHEIEILPERHNKLLVTLEVDKKIALTDSSYAKLTSSLLGDVSINLSIRPGTRLMVDEDTLMSDREQSLQEMLADRATPIADNIDETISNLNDLMLTYKKVGEHADVVLVNLAQSTISLNSMMDDNKNNVNTIARNMAELSKSLVRMEKDIEPMIQKFRAVADSLDDHHLASAVRNLDAALININTITAKINEGQGSAGKLVNDEALYINLEKATKSLDELLVDFKARPKRYVHFSVFGGKNKSEKKDDDD